MKLLYLDKLGISGHLKSGYVDLYDRGGNKHRVDALFVPGYDWVPCARKLLNNFTTDACYLALVLTEGDPDTAYSSTIWITRPKVTSIEDWDELEEDENNPIYVSDFFDKYKIKKGKRLFVVRRCNSIDKDNDNWSEYDFCLGLVKGYDDSDKPIYSYFTYPDHFAATFGGFESIADVKNFLKEHRDFIVVREPYEGELFGSFYSTLHDYDF